MGIIKYCQIRILIKPIRDSERIADRCFKQTFYVSAQYLMVNSQIVNDRKFNFSNYLEVLIISDI